MIKSHAPRFVGLYVPTATAVCAVRSGCTNLVRVQPRKAWNEIGEHNVGTRNNRCENDYLK